MEQLTEHVVAALRRIVIERKDAAAGFSQRELARRIGCSSPHMTHLLSGRSPMTLDWLGKICTALAVEPAQLLDGKDRSAFDRYPAPHAYLHQELQQALDHGFQTQIKSFLASYRKAMRHMELLCRLLCCAARAEAVILSRKSDPNQVLYSSSGNQGRSPGWQRFASTRFEVRLLKPKGGEVERLARLLLQCIGQYPVSFSPSGKE